MSTQGLVSQLSGLRMMSLRDVAAELPEPNSLRFARAPPGFARAPVAPPTALGQEVQRNQTGAMPILGLAPGQRLVRRVAQYDMRQLDPSLGFKIVAPGAHEEPIAPPMICIAPTGWRTDLVHDRLDLHVQDLHRRLAPVLARPATLGLFTVPPKASLGQEMTQGQTASRAMPTQKRKMPTPCGMGVHERGRHDMPHADKDAAPMGGPAKKFHDAAEQVENDIFGQIGDLVADCDISGRSEEMEAEETGPTARA